jgi:hypothetical protein
VGGGELWESGQRGPVPVPVPTRPNTDQMVADVVRKPVITREGRSAVVHGRKPKPRAQKA